MSLLPLAPNLDDRTFQDIVDEAKRLIPRFCPEWTDHNVSDPGVALIELFAWITESMIFRLNQVPDKTYIHFLDMIGIRLLPPQAAVAQLTFSLSSPQVSPVSIPTGTEVATVRSPDWEVITFSSTEPLVIEPPVLSTVLTSSDGARFVERLDRVSGISPFQAFDTVPRPGNAWYLGFAGNLSRHIIRLKIQTDQGRGVKVGDTPVLWEAWGGEDRGWLALSVLNDTTLGLLVDGMVELELPADLAETILGDRHATTWVRARIIPLAAGQKPFDLTPRINGVSAEAIGGLALARHARPVRGESLGYSTGAPGQTFTLSRAPILPPRDGEFLEVGDGNGGWMPWILVESFAASGPDDPHYLCDPASGVIQLGPEVRSPKGTVRQYGAIPIKGAPLRFSRYMLGGGSIGNVGRHSLVVLKSSLPYVASVTNRQSATGGADLETFEHAKMRAGSRFRTLDRAVTAADFETLARQATTAVARARCLGPAAFSGRNAPKPGAVVVAIVPVVPAPMRPIEADELHPSADLMETVRAYLDDRRLVTTVVSVRPARVIRVAVQAQIMFHAPYQSEQTRGAVERALYDFLNPVVGGPDGSEGWPFGRDLSIYEIHAVIQGVPGVSAVENVRLSVVDSRGRGRDGGVRIPIPADAVIASARHSIAIAGRR